MPKWTELSSPELNALPPPVVGLVPVGATEQHGPHLPNGTDTLIAEALCERAAARSGALVLPAIAVACSYGHGARLAGTLALAPETLAQVVRDYAGWAAASGVRRLVFVNAHVGNSAALTVATDPIRLFRPDLRVAIVDWWYLTDEITKEATSDAGDFHANRAETSVMLALYPELVRQELLAGADDEDRTAGLVFRYTQPALSRNGVTGRPSQATSELGARLLDLAVAALGELVDRARREEPPLGEPAAPHVDVRRPPPDSG